MTKLEEVAKAISVANAMLNAFVIVKPSDNIQDAERVWEAICGAILDKAEPTPPGEK